jgi:hypothetical protein
MSKFTDVQNWQFKYKFFPGTITGRYLPNLQSKPKYVFKSSSGIEVGKKRKTKAKPR